MPILKSLRNVCCFGSHALGLAQKRGNFESLSRRHLIVSIASTVVIIAAVGFATVSLMQSGDPELDASAFVTNVIYGGMKTVGDPKLDPAARERRFTELLIHNVDTPRLARFALGRYWNSASERERNDFIAVYPGYLARTFSARLGQFAGAMVSVSSTKRIDDEIQVNTNIYFMGPRPSSASTSQWEIGWLVRATPDGLKIKDVDIQGVSLKLQERTDVMSLITTAGETVTGLVNLIQKTIATPAGG